MPTLDAPPTTAARPALLRFFLPDPPAPHLATDPAEVATAYRRHQRNILTATILGYAVYYFVRKNLSVAMPALSKDLGITKTDLGLFLTLHGVIYGVSKFLNGFLGDRANARTFMATGLILSAAANFAFGSSSTAMAMGAFWLINGYVQGMGFPPCARLLTHWFPPRQLATKMAIWNSSHSIGAFAIVILCGFLVASPHLGWRACFYVPAAIATLTALYLLVALPDTPESKGLPPVESLDPTAAPPLARRADDAAPPAAVDSSAAAPAQAALDYESAAPAHNPPFSHSLKLVFSNPYIWLLSLANFFVYTIRYAILDWAPTFLHEHKGFTLTHASWITAAYELAGVAGALAAGVLTDKLFAGRGARACIVFMIPCAVALYLFYALPTQSELTAALLLSATGFLIYGPQCLIGVAVANLATKHAAATAVGLTGLFGYLSTILSGVGLGYLVHHHGWPTAFRALIAIALIATALFIACFPAKSHGYPTGRASH